MDLLTFMESFNHGVGTAIFEKWFEKLQFKLVGERSPPFRKLTFLSSKLTFLSSKLTIKPGLCVYGTPDGEGF
jgi:hypothetical protein